MARASKMNKIRIPIRLPGSWSETLAQALPGRWASPFKLWNQLTKLKPNQLMLEYLPKSLNDLKVPLLQSVHYSARASFAKAGFQWELRNQGERKIGLWRKKFREKSAAQAYPKRLIIIPGFGDTPLSWFLPSMLAMRKIRVQFDEVIFFDFPGFSGFLSSDKCFDSMDALLDMASDTLDSLKPHTVLGHSLGGWILGYYAGKCGAGERPLGNQKTYAGPARIIIVDPSGVFGGPEAETRWEAKFKRIMDGGFEFLRPDLFAKEPVWFPLMASEFSRFIAKKDVHDFMRSFRRDHSIDEWVKKIRAETWLFWGEKDTLCPTEWINHWLNLLSPQTPTHSVIFNGVGHSPQVEAPAQVAQAMIAVFEA